MAVQSASYTDLHLSEEDIKSRYIQPALEDGDYFDIICHVAFVQKPFTRKERIEGVRDLENELYNVG
jgi:hypothetical protein